MQLGQGAVHQLAGQALRQGLEHLVDGHAAGQPLAGAGDLGGAPGVHLVVQAADQGHGAALRQPAAEALHAGVDDVLGLRHRGLAALAGTLHPLGQVVDRVEVHLGQAGHFRLDVARHGQVEQQHRAASPGLERTLHRAQPDQGQRAGGAGHHDVELGQPLGQVGQGHGLPAQRGGQCLAAGQRAVG